MSDRWINRKMPDGSLLPIDTHHMCRIEVADPEPGEVVRVSYPGPMCKEVLHFGIFEPTQDFGITEQL